ncbi:TniQ family protein [Salimicrobium flavidum]|uniref:Transcriptional regulator, TetR family n=1 Tax=Salimicrobium flavidum TaxID=570947 RepID=A0A1N7J2L8_9BACI|nr:TniQ family protein [Salimicrobium flavidum]SIS43461.1 transcriptional regulator, TetR family [Salimicrobium flavidum]
MYIYKDRSVIYNLPPINEDLLTKESLTSYLVRLSNEHQLTVNDMVRRVLEIEFNKNSIDKKINFSKYLFENSETINGYGKSASELVIALNELSSREGIEKLTFLNWKKLIPSRNLLDKNFKYCPDCLKDWKDENKLYYPLIWGLNLVEVCIKHQKRLLNYCVNCNEQITFLKGKMVLGRCSKCFGLLYDDNFLPQKINVDGFQKYVHINLNYLISLDSIDYESCRNDFINNLNIIQTKYFNNELKSMSVELQIPKTSLYEYLTGEQFPSLKNLVSIGYSMNLSIRSLLEKEISLNADSPKSCDRIDIHKKTSGGTPIDRLKMKEKLKETLVRSEPTSLVRVAEEMGRDRKLLYNHFPELSKEISDKYSEFLKNKTFQRRKVMKLQIENAYYALIKDGIYPSRRQIENKLKKPGLLREKPLQNYWKFLLKRDGYS